MANRALGGYGAGIANVKAAIGERKLYKKRHYTFKMAGGFHATVDPAFVKHGNMFTNRHKYFYWTKRTAWITFAYVAIVPSIVGYIAYTTDGKYDLRGKKRGNTIAEF